MVATFSVQHALNAGVSPAAGGTLNPPGQSFHDKGDTASLTAIPNTGYIFTGWTGAGTGSSNPIRIVMDTTKAITAHFETGIVVTLQTNPPGRTIVADGVPRVAPVQVSWRPGTPHTIGVPVTQAGEMATRHKFQSWSDGGDSTHSVAPTRDTTFTATFNTEYFLFTSVTGSGTVTPPAGWFPANSVVQIQANPQSGYGFIQWSGTGDGSYSGFNNPVTITMLGWVAQTAEFGELLPPPSLAGIGNGAVDQPVENGLAWNEYPGATSYIVQVGVDSLFSLNGLVVDTSGITDTTFALPTLENLATYYWRIKARVDGDITLFSDTWRFTTGPAVIAITSPSINWGTGFVYPITWVTENLSGNVNILLSKDGGREYETIYAEHPNNGSTTWRPRDADRSNFCILRVVSAKRAQFFAESPQFAIATGTLPLTVPLTKSVVFPAEPTTSTAYRLVALPGVVDTTKLLGAIVPGQQGSDWKMFADNGQPAGYLVELHANNHLSTGRGYWLVKKNNLDVTIDMAMPPLDTAGAIYRIPLQTGWNILTNPFDRAVQWSAVVAANGLEPAAVAHGYDGSYQAAASIAPFEGYYFFNEDNLSELMIPYPFGGAPPGGTVPVVGVPGADWTLAVRYESGLNSDDGVTIGIASPATEGRDPFEGRKPPRFLDQGSLYFDRPEWDPVYSEFAADLRPDLGDGQVWEFTVTKEQGASGTIGFAGVENIPAGLEAVLINPYNTTPVDLRGTPEYAFTGVARTMTFKVAVGTPEFVRTVSEELVPEQIGLAQNFPNPFNSVTSISVRLPRESRIRLDVHNVLGQIVSTIADGDFGPGTHTFTWEGTDAGGRAVASGVYLYRLLEGESLIETKKMVITK